MSSNNSARLLQIVESSHNCRAEYLRHVIVRESFEGESVWEGEVSVFNVDHPAASLCYAWISETDEGGKKTYAVLGKPPIDSPEKAVRAAIVSDYKGEKT